MESEWLNCRWGDIVTLEYGKSLRNYEASSDKYPVYGTNGQIGWHSDPLCKFPSVIIGRKGAYRGIHYSSMPFFVIDTAFYLNPKIEMDTRWAYYCLLTYDINSMDSGSAIPSTSRDDFYALPVTVPPIDEQHAIAYILGSLDNKIELNRRMNTTLEEFARALFKSWFMDFDPVRAKMAGRPPEGIDAETAALFPDRLVESKLGLVPEGWRVGTFGEVLSVLETGDRPKGGVGDYMDGIPSIGAESIVGLGIFDYSKTKYVPEQYFASLKRGVLKDRDVLLYKDGGRPGIFIPHVSIFGDGFPFSEMSINSHVYRLRSETLSQEFLYFWVSSDLIMHQMHLLGGGAAIPGINSAQVRLLPSLVPSEAIVNAFTVNVSAIISQILTKCKESRVLAITRDTLLPKLLSGAVRVSSRDVDIEGKGL